MASVGSLGGVPAGSASSSARTESLKPSQPMAHSQPIGTSSPPPVVHPLNSAAGMPPPGSQTLWSARLMDLLNLVRHEFDVIGNDAVHFKSQRDELEHRIAQQFNEVNLMQEHVYELEKRHFEIVGHCEDEIKRLRALLDGRAGHPVSGAAHDVPTRHNAAANPLDTRQSFAMPPPMQQPFDREPRERMLPAMSSVSGDAAWPPAKRAKTSGVPPFPSEPMRLKLDERDHKRGAVSGHAPMSERHEPQDGGAAPDSRKTAAGAVPNAVTADSLSSQSTHATNTTSASSTSSTAAPSQHTPPTPATQLQLQQGARTSSASTPSPEHGRPDAKFAPSHESAANGTQAYKPTAGSAQPAGGLKEGEKSGSSSSALPAKKEDWNVMHNPNTKALLDVNLVHTFTHDSVVCCVRFSPDGKYLATGCNRSAQVFNAETGAKVCELQDPTAPTTGDPYIRSVCFSPDGKYLATGAEDRQIRIWDIEERKVKLLLSGHKQEIYSLEYSRDGQILASGSGDKTVRLWDAESGKELHVLYTSPGLNYGPGVTTVTLSPDGRLVAAGALDTFVRLWDTKTGKLRCRLKGHRDSIYSVCFMPDGQSLVSGSLDKSLKLWDLSSIIKAIDTLDDEVTNSSLCKATFTGHKDYVLSVSCSPDGRWIASGSKDRCVQFWDTKLGQTQLVLQGHKNSVIAINLSPAKRLLATGSGDFNARIWSYEDK